MTKITFRKDAQLTVIGEGAFGLCIHLKEITLPDSLEEMGDYSLGGCWELTKANLGNGVKKAGGKLLQNCLAMTSLTVPDTLEEIGGEMLDGHHEKLVVTCGEGSAMETYLKQYYPDVRIEHRGR